MTDGALERAWRGYRDLVIQEPLTAQQEMILRRVFTAGAVAVLDYVLADGADTPFAVVVKRMGELADELAEDEKAGRP